MPAHGRFANLGTGTLVKRVTRLREVAKGKASDARTIPSDLDGAVIAHLRAQTSDVIDGWLVVMSAVRTRESMNWNASASLYPKGRGSCEDDWSTLGRIVAATGAIGVEDQLRGQIGVTPPNAPHHWFWKEPHDADA